MYAEKRHKEKIQMRKQIKAHEERNVKSAAPENDPSNPVPAYLLDRNNPASAKALSSSIKNKCFIRPMGLRSRRPTLRTPSLESRK